MRERRGRLQPTIAGASWTSSSFSRAATMKRAKSTRRVMLLSRMGSPTCRLHTGRPWLPDTTPNRLRTAARSTTRLYCCRHGLGQRPHDAGGGAGLELLCNQICPAAFPIRTSSRSSKIPATDQSPCSFCGRRPSVELDEVMEIIGNTVADSTTRGRLRARAASARDTEGSNIVGSISREHAGRRSHLLPSSDVMHVSGR